MAKVSPIYKFGFNIDQGNYHPISVLPVISKILEKVLHCRLEKYFKSINSIIERQHGFRTKSNVTATADHVTKMKYNIDRKNIILSIFIDLKMSLILSTIKYHSKN